MVSVGRGLPRVFNPHPEVGARQLCRHCQETKSPPVSNKIEVKITDRCMATAKRHCTFNGPLSLALRHEGYRWSGPGSNGNPIENGDEVFLDFKGEPMRVSIPAKTAALLQRFHDGHKVTPFTVKLFFSRFRPHPDPVNVFEER